MRSGINFNSPDTSTSQPRPGATGQSTEDNNHNSVSVGTGDDILDDLFSDDDNSPSHSSGDVSGRSSIRSDAPNSSSGSLQGSDYNPLLDDEDDDNALSEEVRSRSHVNSGQVRTGAQKVSQVPHNDYSAQSSGPHVSRHSVSRPVSSDSVSRETSQAESTVPRRVPLRRPDTQQVIHDSARSERSELDRRSLPSHNESGHSAIHGSNENTSSKTSQPAHRRRIGIPPSDRSQESPDSASGSHTDSQSSPQVGHRSADNSSARQTQAHNDSLPDSTDNHVNPANGCSGSLSDGSSIQNMSTSDTSDTGATGDVNTSDMLNRRSVTPPVRRSLILPTEPHPLHSDREDSSQGGNGSASSESLSSVLRETLSTESSGSTGESGTDNSSSIQSSTTNTGSSSGHYWVGSNVPSKKNTGYSADENDSTGIDEDGSESNKSSSDPTPRKRGRGRPRNFLNTILPENRGNDFAERRWQGARQTKDFAPHVGFPIRSKEEEAELRRRQRAGETIPGRKKRDPKKKYHRKTITEKDILVFELAAITGACTYNPVAVLLGMKHASSARKRVLGLKEMKMLRTAHSLKIDGVMFDLTRRAVNQMYKNGSGVDKDCISLKKDVTGLKSRETSYHNTILAYTLAKECALHGLRPAMFYNEDWMARRCSGSYKGIGIEARNERVAEYRRQMMKAYRELSQGVREGIMERYPMLWVPCGKEDDLSNYSAWHQPDLILNRDWRNEKGQSKSVAYEIEMTPKSPGDIDKIMRTLGWSGWFAYGEVRYVVVSDMIGRAVERSRDRIVEEFRNLARTAPDSQDRAFYKSGANFLANALTIERLSDMNGNLFDTGDQEWI